MSHELLPCNDNDGEELNGVFPPPSISLYTVGATHGMRRYQNNNRTRSTSMHISNDRYFDDRQRHDLALRMIRHEARTCTIRGCTGLTDDRIRRLYQSYATQRPTVHLRRRRGKSPRQIAFFTRNAQVQFEASLLAAVFASLNLIDASSAKRDLLALGERFCDAFETYAQLVPTGALSFEHGWFLLQLLLRKNGVLLLRCRQCTGHFVYDRSNVMRRPCPACQLKQGPVRASGRRRRASSRRRAALTSIQEIRA
jgi:hypothetical protein